MKVKVGSSVLKTKNITQEFQEDFREATRLSVFKCETSKGERYFIKVFNAFLIDVKSNTVYKFDRNGDNIIENTSRKDKSTFYICDYQEVSAVLRIGE